MRDFFLLTDGLSRVIEQFLFDLPEVDEGVLKKVFEERFWVFGGALWLYWGCCYRKEGEFRGYELFFTAGAVPFRVWLVDKAVDYRDSWRWRWLRGFRIDPTVPLLDGEGRKARWVLVKGVLEAVRDVVRESVMGQEGWRGGGFSKWDRWLFLAWLRTVFKLWEDERFRSLFLRGRKPETRNRWAEVLNNEGLKELLEKAIPLDFYDEPMRPWKVLREMPLEGLEKALPEVQVLVKEGGGFLLKGRNRFYLDVEALLFQDERVQSAWDAFLREAVDYLVCPVIVERETLLRGGKINLFGDPKELCRFLSRALLVYWCRRVGVLEDLFSPAERKKLFDDLARDYFRLLEKAFSKFHLKSLDKRGYALLERLKREVLSQCHVYFAESLTDHYGVFFEPFIVPFFTWRGMKEVWSGEEAERELKVPRLVFLPFYARVFQEEFINQSRVLPISDELLKRVKAGSFEEEAVPVVMETQQRFRVISFLRGFVSALKSHYLTQWLEDGGDETFWHTWIEPAFPSAEHLWWNLYRYRRNVLEHMKGIEELASDGLTFLRENLEKAFLSLFSRNLSGAFGQAYLNSPKCKAKNLDNAQRLIRKALSKSGRDDFWSLVHSAKTLVKKYNLTPVAVSKKKPLVFKSRPLSLISFIHQQKQAQPETVFLPEHLLKKLKNPSNYRLVLEYLKKHAPTPDISSDLSKYREEDR